MSWRLCGITDGKKKIFRPIRVLIVSVMLQIDIWTSPIICTKIIPFVFTQFWWSNSQINVSSFLLLLLSEEIWFLPTWWIWFGTGAIPHMAAEQTAYQRCLSVPTLYWKVSTIKQMFFKNFKWPWTSQYGTEIRTYSSSLKARVL